MANAWLVNTFLKWKSQVFEQLVAEQPANVQLIGTEELRNLLLEVKNVLEETQEGPFSGGIKKGLVATLEKVAFIKLGIKTGIAFIFM